MENNLEFFHIFENLEKNLGQPKKTWIQQKVADGRNKDMTADGGLIKKNYFK